VSYISLLNIPLSNFFVQLSSTIRNYRSLDAVAATCLFALFCMSYPGEICISELIASEVHIQVQYYCSDCILRCQVLSDNKPAGSY
jgi:hypothetical protein